ncbi:hypothetical protein [Salinibacter ruber]|uniref:Uncharacterized protein n=1 Tax=Salinibacter ruber TaxID=146919 RepID=A0A9X2U3X5_9BACT|nr:hypothetical protein [Salinibacter ruber]MCS3859263.1 hypothetical protein [Salinibacter ruber]MCS3866143.1 hypothetical protein [Salinibacter ruber]MCS4152109.1 hypothetical protein [Salinibacter ruber]MCS4178298.1 hypothetical protein [Salinibacter ruber]
MPSSSNSGGPEQDGPDPPWSSSIVPASLLKRAGALLFRHPGRGLAAYAALAVGLSAATFLPRGAAALLGASSGAPALPDILSEPSGAFQVLDVLPTYSFSPPDYPGQPTGQAVGEAIEYIEQVPITISVGTVPEVFLAAGSSVAAFLLAGPAVAGAYALALPCTREKGAGSSSLDKNILGTGSLDTGSLDTSSLGTSGLSGKAILSSVGVYAAASVATLTGLLLLVVPGAVVAAGLAPLMPLIVDTGQGPRRAIRRAWRLTEGHRWQIFNLYLLVWIAATVATGIAAVVAFGTESLGGPAGLVGVGAGLLFGTGVGAWSLLARCCLYRRLKRLEGGKSTRRRKKHRDAPAVVRQW